MRARGNNAEWPLHCNSRQVARTSYAATPTWPCTASIAAHQSCLHTLYRQLLLRSSIRLHAQQLCHHLTATCTVARCTPAWSKTPGHGLPSHHLLLTVHICKLMHIPCKQCIIALHMHTLLACISIPSVRILLSYLHPSNCLYIPVNVLSIKHCFLRLQHLV